MQTSTARFDVHHTCSDDWVQVRDVGPHPYLSALAVRTLAADPPDGFVEVDGTLAFFDISGFTPLTERLATVGRAGAEHINDVLNTVFTGLIDVVFRFGGDVLEFGGDAMVVLYSGPQHERRAAIAAVEMNRFMTRLGRVDTPAGKVRLGGVVRHGERNAGVLPARSNTAGARGRRPGQHGDGATRGACRIGRGAGRPSVGCRAAAVRGASQSTTRAHGC